MSGIFSMPPAQPSCTAHGFHLTSCLLEVKKLSPVSERWLVKTEELVSGRSRSGTQNVLTFNQTFPQHSCFSSHSLIFVA